MKAREIMTTPALSVAPDDSVKMAAQTMVQHRISGLTVVDEHARLVGILSETDLLHRTELGTVAHHKWWLTMFGDADRYARAYAKSHGTVVRDVMSRQVVTVEADTDLAAVARALDDQKIKRVPVMEHGRLVGMITRGDLVRVLAQTAATVAIADLDDSRLHERVTKRMREQDWLEGHFVSVFATGGHVTLRGFVPTQDQRTALAVLVRGTEGVAILDDQLVIGRPTLSAV
jgi:CBS domain-containing protein